ncbi:MAG TPA: MgtC/SapB family protein [Spirochaetota bacterium]|nr:MgtC/SapB family protein [Spirochaetota bacterium]HQO00770.1 MgtC/SapB family protein [Spirochaetota bacterium]
MIDAITGESSFSALTIFLRLLCAVVAGFAVGFEREKRYQPAGLRTHMVLALGAAVIMVMSIALPIQYLDTFPNSDPGRLSAQVISGIGFLGAGAIFRYGFNVRGLTTAASIWTTSGIGLAFGAGLYMIGALGTGFLIVILRLFGFVEEKMMERKNMRVLTIVFHPNGLDVKMILNAIRDFDLSVRETQITEYIESNTVELRITCRVDEDMSIRKLFTAIKALGNIKTLRIE